MANKEIWLDMDAEQTALVGGQLDGLRKTLQRLTQAITGAFAVQRLWTYFSDAAKAGGMLDKELLVLRLALGKLKAAVGRAVAPIGELLIPVLNKAVFAVTRAVNWFGQILGALLSGARGMDAMTESSEETQKAITGVGTALRRTVAGFDQLERLDGGSGGGGTGVDAGEILQEQAAELDLWQKLIVSKIQTILEPLKKISFAPAVEAFHALQEAIRPFGQQLFEGLKWAWNNLLVPLAGWTVEKVLPAFLELVAQAAQTLNTVLQAAKPHLSWLWEKFLQPVAQWTGGVILSVLEGFSQKLQNLSAWVLENSDRMREITVVAGAFLAIWAGGQLAAWLQEASGLSGFLSGAIQSVLTLSGVVQLLQLDFFSLPEAVQNGWNGIRQALQAGSKWFRESFLAPMTAGVRSAANGVIGFLNGLLSAATQGMNALVRGINSLRFTVPAWVPGLGGKSLGFSLKSLTTPQIPYLAQGAVLPANSPFLAVVGDQRHGTNVEAPLSVIQEAVAVVLSEQLSGMMAGFAEVVRAIEEKQNSVVIGDDVIYGAAERYSRKLAVAKGGF